MIADVSMVNELLATTITSIYLLSYKRVNKHDIFADVSGGHEKIFATAKFWSTSEDRYVVSWIEAGSCIFRKWLHCRIAICGATACLNRNAPPDSYTKPMHIYNKLTANLWAKHKTSHSNNTFRCPKTRKRCKDSYLHGAVYSLLQCKKSHGRALCLVIRRSEHRQHYRTLSLVRKAAQKSRKRSWGPVTLCISRRYFSSLVL